MTIRLFAVSMAACALVAPGEVSAQASIGQEPRYPDVGSPPAGIPIIDEGSVLLCIGMSQANDECSGPRPDHDNGWLDQTTLPVVIVNGGIDSFDVRKIMLDPELWWTQIEERIQRAGYTNDDVQLIWGKNATRSGVDQGGSGDLLAERTVLRDNLIEIQQQAEARFENLRAGFHSARIFGGFCNLNSEPFSYDTIFAIEGWDGEPGAIDASPLWHRGPYIWADGEVPRADGLTWLEDDFIDDGCHPSQSGVDKVVTHNEIFFSQLTYAPAGSGTVPAAPADLAATSVDEQAIDLAWTDQSGDEAGFRIERSQGPTGTFAEIALTAADATGYADSGLAGDTEYCYRIRAFNNVGNSGYTPSSCATTAAAATPPPPPPAPAPVRQPNSSSGGGAMHGLDILLLLLAASFSYRHSRQNKPRHPFMRG